MLTLILLVAIGSASAQWYDGATCGRSKYANAGEVLCPNRIVGGCETRPNEFPWQVSLQRTQGGSHFCGGSVVNAEWIVTAAHCVEGSGPNAVWVDMGEHARNVNSGTEVLTQSSDVIWHPLYDSQTTDYDVAVIKLSSPVALNENIWPICAPSTTDHTAFAGLRGQISGWGTLSSGGACCPNNLQWVDVLFLTDAQCRSSYPNSITARMVCGGEDDYTVTDTCQGDSGGPFTHKRANGQFELVGDTSWGIGCASGWPGVYGSIPSMRDWITTTINSN